MNKDSAVLFRALDHPTHLLEQLHTRRAGAGEIGPGEADENAVEERDSETEHRMN